MGFATEVLHLSESSPLHQTTEPACLQLRRRQAHRQGTPQTVHRQQFIGDGTHARNAHRHSADVRACSIRSSIHAGEDIHLRSADARHASLISFYPTEIRA
jgi:hypothetical protein